MPDSAARTAHADGVERLLASYRAIPSNASVRLAKPTSNLFRARAKRDAPGLDTSGLTDVIAVDPDSRTADVAPKLALIALFGVLTVFIPIGIDLYLPALPTIAREFDEPISAIEHSLAAFFLGLAIGQAMVGPLSDRFGRRRPLLIGLVLYILGSAACAIAQDPLALPPVSNRRWRALCAFNCAR